MLFRSVLTIAKQVFQGPRAKGGRLHETVVRERVGRLDRRPAGIKGQCGTQSTRRSSTTPQKWLHSVTVIVVVKYSAIQVPIYLVVHPPVVQNSSSPIFAKHVQEPLVEASGLGIGVVTCQARQGSSLTLREWDVLCCQPERRLSVLQTAERIQKTHNFSSSENPMSNGGLTSRNFLSYSFRELNQPGS